jgi:predicted ribosome quality control (RQC) complex YloA/Tae2 family protein
VVNLSVETSERFTALDSRSQLIIDSLLERRKEFSEELRDQTLAIAQLLSRSEIAIVDHLEESKARILGTVQEAQRITSLNGIAKDQLLRSKKAEALCRDMTEKSLLEGLQFSTMMQRQKEVTEAYRKTFEWIFQDLSLE